MKRFVVMATMTEAEEAAFLGFLRERGLGWWHHVPGCWLLKSNSETLTATDIRDQLHDTLKVAPPILVMDIFEDRGWAGTLPKDKPDTFKWLKRTWTDTPPKE